VSDIVSSNLIASKVLVTLAVLGYFWGVEKSDKCLQLGKLTNFKYVQQHAALCRGLPPVSLFDPGVFLRAMFVVMPCWMAESMSASDRKELVFLASLCMFVAPIVPPSMYSPPPGASLISFSLIWVAAKVDASVRAAIAIGLTMLIARIPGVSGFVSGAMDSLFPIIGEGGSAQLFRAALEGGALFAFIMLLIRSSQLVVYGWAKATGFLVCFAISWGLLQYFAEGVFKLDAMVVGQVLGSFLIVTLAGFVVDLYAHRHSE
jgi:hypothetical protein